LLESDPDVNWIESQGSMRFTLTDSLAKQLTGYRCSVHPRPMRGQIKIVD